MKVLYCLLLSVSVTSVSAQSFMERVRDKYLYSDYEIEGVEKSYDKADVFIPNKFFTTTPSNINVDKKYPVVIYLHGCTGITQHDYQWAKYISDMGYIVVQPNSLARPNTKVACDRNTFKSISEMAQGKALMFRQQEIKYALTKVKSSSWADTNNIFLMGHSQGGISTALNKLNDFKGLIISGWTCTDSLIGGIHSVTNMPVLVIAYDNDPWRQDKTKGRCIDVATQHASLKQLDLVGNYHGTVDNLKAREEVKMFLTKEE